ncbi:MAG: thioredoxin family protein [Balneolaceae bacterium]
MKRPIIITLLIAGFLGIFLYNAFDAVTPEEIENAPEWMALDDALDRASQENKLVLVDIFEVGCQFCRAMNRDVYPAPSTRSVLDREFFPVKINGNSDSVITFRGVQMPELEFAQQMGVTAYPFTVILDPEGNIVDRRRGYMDVQTLTRFMRNAVEQQS